MEEWSIKYTKREFAETLGYIRGDLRWLLEKNSGLNYTIGLLIGCGCEMLAACGEDGKRLGEKVFADLLPPGEWQQLTNRLYGALRDGLAHGFDTKHLRVDGTQHQIYLDSRGAQGLYIVKNDRGIGLHIGVRDLAERLCTKIDEMEVLVANDEVVRQRFMKSRQRTTDLSAKEADAWRSLVKAAGYGSEPSFAGASYHECSHAVVTKAFAIGVKEIQVCSPDPIFAKLCGSFSKPDPEQYAAAPWRHRCVIARVGEIGERRRLGEVAVLPTERWQLDIEEIEGEFHKNATGAGVAEFMQSLTSIAYAIADFPAIWSAVQKLSAVVERVAVPQGPFWYSAKLFEQEINENLTQVTLPEELLQQLESL